MITGGTKKRLRAIPTRKSTSSCAVIDGSFSDESLCVVFQKPRTCRSPCIGDSSATTPFFNDSSTADVILRLFVDSASPLGSSFSSDSGSVDPAVSTSDLHVYLHSDILRRAKYFSVILSDRWSGQSRPQESDGLLKLNLGVPLASGAIQSHLTVLELLYTDDFANTIDSASTALDLLPVALELLFEECVRSCVTFLEAVPWSEEEERRVLNLIPFLREEESKELLARVSPAREDSCEVMLEGLISSAIHNYQNTAFVKAFVAKILRDFSSRESAKRVLEKAFNASLQTAKECLEEYSSPDFRGGHNETEALQRSNLHEAMTRGRHLQWLLDRMIELRVADAAVIEWSEQAAFTADLQRAFRDDAWRNIVPGLPAVLLRCTYRLAKAVSAGAILAARQVRRKLVEGWLPVLVVCKDSVSPMSPYKALYLELEETFLRIISTLPMSDAQELLPKCLSFSTRNVEDCPHLVTAFNTWFRRAAQPVKPDYADNPGE
ncbi:BTB/POZ domain-containing protein At1g63850-like [Prosopis cineraria]|uniref:BTB/POZ domain-containing protein At1g63850-like n=1 Tax=Prosopis cineraria TaxID=364024 RepID=UPI00240ECEC5|nr:BTB/POZ domain-containing protein At1g63850-like [Prosopis cineraria]